MSPPARWTTMESPVKPANDNGDNVKPAADGDRRTT